MNKTAKTLFLIVACLFPIIIGSLHTLTHFRDLIKPEIKEYLQEEVDILGTMQPLWNTWGIVSFMMGASFIVIGLLNMAVFRSTPKTGILPILPLLAVIFYQCCIIYVGAEFDQSFQLYGGIFGLVLITIVLLLTLRLKMGNASERMS